MLSLGSKASKTNQMGSNLGVRSCREGGNEAVSEPQAAAPARLGSWAVHLRPRDSPYGGGGCIPPRRKQAQQEA